MSAESIVAAFERFRMAPSNIDQYENGGKTILVEKIGNFVSRDCAIKFVMLGYPFKSTNHDHKTIGVLPDLAEEVSLDNFRSFGQTIASVYPPGVRIDIVSDGFVFNDLLGETTQTVDAYAEITAGMVNGAPLSFLSLRDFYKGDALDTAREKVTKDFGVDETELARRILMEPDVTMLYRGMIHFMEEELANRQYPSKRQHHLAAKNLARQMMFRNEAYSQLVSSQFRESIRLSMHPSTNHGKYSFQLIPGPNARYSPWHCAVLVEKDGQFTTIHKSDAEAAGHALVTRDGRPYNYQVK